MKKFTTFLALFLMCFGMVVQAGIPMPELTTDSKNPKWYVIRSYRSGNFMGYNTKNGLIEQLTKQSEATMWYFLKNDDGMLMVNGLGDQYKYFNEVSEDGKVDKHTANATGTKMYFVQHSFNKCGMSICKNPSIKGSDCIDAKNNKAADDEFYGVGWWHPSAGDNEGTSWYVETVATSIDAAIKSMESPYIGTLKNDAGKKAQWEQYKKNASKENYLKFIAEKEALGLKMPEAGKTYLVKNAYSGFLAKQGVEKGLYSDEARPKWADCNKFAKNHYWKIEAKGNGYSFQNVADNKYIKAFDALSANSNEAAALTFAMLNAEGVMNIKIGNEVMHADGHRGGSGKGGNIVSYAGGANTASAWTIEEAVLKLPVNVKYDYYLDGKVVYSETIQQSVGDDFVVRLQRPYATFEIKTKGKVAEGMKAVEVECTEKDYPFVKTTDFNKANWYIVDIHGQNRYWNATAEEGKIKTPVVAKEAEKTEFAKTAYKWCFVGNAVTGFKIYNKEKGEYLALTNKQSYADFVEAEKAIAWQIYPSQTTENAVCFNDGNTNLNHQEVNDGGGTLMYWSAFDEGSSCRFYKATIPDANPGEGIEPAKYIDLPELTTDINQPKWYAIRNIRGNVYANYTKADKNMSLSMLPSNYSYFYFVGAQDGEGVVKVKIYNRAAGDLSCAGFTEWNEAGADWYIQKSGNKDIPGLAISLQKDLKQNAAWNNVAGSNTTVGSWNGNDVGSTWELIPVQTEMAEVLNELQSNRVDALVYNGGAYDVMAKNLQKSVVDNDPTYFGQCVSFKNVLTQKVELKIGKTYMLVSAAKGFAENGAKKAMYIDANGVPGWADLNDLDKNFYWEVEGTPSMMKLRNVGVGTFLKDYSSMTGNIYEAAKVEFNKVARMQFNIKMGSGNINANGNNNGSAQSGNIVGTGKGADNFSSWYLVEAEPAEGVKVTYNYYYNGKQIASAAKVQRIGNHYDAPSIGSFYRNFYENDQLISKTNTSVKVNVVEANVPFVVSKNFKDAKWYYMTINTNKKYLYYEAGAKNMPLNRTTTSNIPDDKDLWCFMGNLQDGYKIYNKAAGQNMILSSPTDMSMGDGENYPILTSLSDFPEGNNQTWDLTMGWNLNGVQGYFLGQHGHPMNRMNDRGSLAYWTGYADAGSTFLFTSAPTFANVHTSIVNQYKDIVDYVGGYSAEDFAALQEVENVPDLNKFLETHKVLDFVENGIYRVKNYQRMIVADGNKDAVGQGGYIGTTQYPGHTQNITCGTNKLDDAGTIWQLVKSGDAYKMKNLNTGKFFNFAEGKFALAEEADANVCTFEKVGDALFELKCNGATPNVSQPAGGLTNWDYDDPASRWHIIKATSLEVAMAKVGEESVASVYVPFGVTMPEGVKAYVATAADTVKSVLKMEAIDAVPANTGVILKGAADKCMLNIATVTATVKKNLLKGSNVEVKVAAADKAKYLVMGIKNDTVVVDTLVGDSLAMNQIYVDAAVAAKGVTVMQFVFGEEEPDVPTGLDEVETPAVKFDNVYYDLSGRRVARPAKGVYILNGKKVFVK